ncbi:keratin-associated protein 5-4-like [Bactrocera tryoni]|uniref:keratin-associated protein 5-4-like n=1 Tax=Bactrocera tryoni TaxID=59916 RepID=UPI001A967F2A|nr:keratin-associated protein 5-4-like [Bactrocera tryoni]
MPPGRKRRTKALAGSGESAASTVVDDSTSGGEGETMGAVKSLSRSKAHLGSPRKENGSEGGSESCGGSATVASVEKVVTRAGSPRNVGGTEGGSGSCGGIANVASAEKVGTRAGSPRNVGGVEGGSGCCGGSALVATTVKATARTGSSRNDGGSGSGSVAHPMPLGEVAGDTPDPEQVNAGSVGPDTCASCTCALCNHTGDADACGDLVGRGKE